MAVTRVLNEQDEVHERHKICDFLLGVLKHSLARCQNLKLILMSATLDVELFQTYFNNCPSVRGKASSRYLAVYCIVMYCIVMYCTVS